MSELDILKVKKYCNLHLNQVNETILMAIQNQNSLIKEVGDFIVSAGGKRVRPMLLFLSALLCKSDCDDNDNDNSDLVKASAVVELIHTASLLHDDIIDESTKRRGKKTANAIWGNKEVILVGDFLFAKSFDLISQIKNTEVIKTLSNACVNLTKGEVSQLSARNQAISIEEYYDIIYCKTASLFEASAKIGSLIACGNNMQDPKITKCSEFGMSLGMSFQIIDDLLDYKSTDSKFGKECGQDFLEGKTTLPVILAKSASNQITTIFENKDFSSQNFTKTLQIMQQHNILERTRQISSDFATKALDILQNFDECDAKSHLTNLLNFFCKRDF